MVAIQRGVADDGGITCDQTSDGMQTHMVNHYLKLDPVTVIESVDHNIHRSNASVHAASLGQFYLDEFAYICPPPRSHDKLYLCV